VTVSIHTRLDYSFSAPTDFLLQIEAAMIPEQTVHRPMLTTTPTDHFVRVAAQDGIGDRCWVRHDGEFTAEYSAEVTMHRILGEIDGMAMVPPHQLPGETVQYLMDSRYCPASRMQHFVCAEFEGQSGGNMVLAMRDWIAQHYSYTPGSSDSNTTAIDSFVERRGVCRDYAHSLIAMVRAAAIPARFVSGYAPDVEPQDFHAIAEVFLASPDGDGGAWHLVDATGMAQACEIAKIAVGRDAADCSFLTCYGPAELRNKQISVQRVG
jgi:transglutaminase-like putative cysteine protease